jgi:hypothetical protein
MEIETRVKRLSEFKEKLLECNKCYDQAIKEWLVQNIPWVKGELMDAGYFNKLIIDDRESKVAGISYHIEPFDYLGESDSPEERLWKAVFPTTDKSLKEVSDAHTLSALDKTIEDLRDPLRENKFYISFDDSHQLRGVWQTDGIAIRRVDAVGTASLRGDHRIKGLKFLQATFPGLNFTEMTLAPGEYYPRMARPFSNSPFDSPGFNPDNVENRSIMAASSGQLHALIESLRRVCRVVHPDEKLTFDTFGHEIRNLIILACTEVEAQWKGVLGAHGRMGNSTVDYRILERAMKLSEFGVAFPYYPWLKPIRPFADWAKTSRPLAWYQAYNKIKHDREKQFERATLRCAFEAITGFFVMLCAQYGWNFAFRDDQAVSAFFHLVDRPKWDASEAYTPKHEGEKQLFDRPKPFAF